MLEQVERVDAALVPGQSNERHDCRVLLPLRLAGRWACGAGRTGRRRASSRRVTRGRTCRLPGGHGRPRRPTGRRRRRARRGCTCGTRRHLGGAHGRLRLARDLGGSPRSGNLDRRLLGRRPRRLAGLVRLGRLRGSRLLPRCLPTRWRGSLHDFRSRRGLPGLPGLRLHRRGSLGDRLRLRGGRLGRHALDRGSLRRRLCASRPGNGLRGWNHCLRRCRGDLRASPPRNSGLTRRCPGRRGVGRCRDGWRCRCWGRRRNRHGSCRLGRRHLGGRGLTAATAALVAALGVVAGGAAAGFGAAAALALDAFGFASLVLSGGKRSGSAAAAAAASAIARRLSIGDISSRRGFRMADSTAASMSLARRVLMETISTSGAAPRAPGWEGSTWTRSSRICSPLSDA